MRRNYVFIVFVIIVALGILIAKYEFKTLGKKHTPQSVIPQVTVLPSIVSPTSNADLSYMLIVANQDVAFKLLYKDGSKLAESFAQQAMNELLYQKPATGDYQLVIVNNSVKESKVTVYFYDFNGNVTMMDKFVKDNTSLHIYFDKKNSNNSWIKDK